MSNDGPDTSRHELRQHLQTTYQQSDIDLFIYGLDEEAATTKLQCIVDTLLGNSPHDAVVVRSSHAVTVVSAFPFRHVQVILRLYKSPAEILMGFDLDWYI